MMPPASPIQKNGSCRFARFTCVAGPAKRHMIAGMSSSAGTITASLQPVAGVSRMLLS